MKSWQESWRHTATSVKVLLKVADGQHNYIRSVCVQAGRRVEATRGVWPLVKILAFLCCWVLVMSWLPCAQPL